MFNTWVGEVMLNSNQSFTKGSKTGSYDLYSVMLQEAGHVLGLGNSSKVNSAMYTEYQQVRSGLSPEDIQAIQQLYGVREQDRLEGAKGNDTQNKAKTLRFVQDADQFSGSDPTLGADPFVAAGDLTTLTDVDYYKVTTPSGTSDFWVHLRTSQISLLTSKVTVLDAKGKVLASSSAVDPVNGNIELFIKSAKANTTYFVKVEAKAKDVFGVGAYRLAIGKEAQEAVFPNSSSNYINPDNGRNESPSTATNLGLARPASDARWDFVAKGSIVNEQDVDFYRIQTFPSTPGIMVATVWATESGKLDPTITVYDNNQRIVPVEILANDSSSYTIQLRTVNPNQQYFFRVAATDPNSSYKEGNYVLAIDFRNTAIDLNPLVNSTLSQTQKDQTYSLAVNKTQLVHLALDTTTQSSIGTRISISIYDQQGRVVSSFSVLAGQTVSTDLFLTAGNYTMKVKATTENANQTLPTTGYNLKALTRTDPISPTIEDPIEDPGLPEEEPIVITYLPPPPSPTPTPIP